MGRASRRKRERRGFSSFRTLLQAIAPFERDSLFALLAASASSPTAIHRQPSIEYALYATVIRRDDGSQKVDASRLPGIVNAARDAAPALETLEDWVPLDPRLPVVTRWGGELLRLHPGAQERPVANVNRAKLVASVIDPVILSQHGFSLTNLIEVSLRYTDAAVRQLETAWSTDSIPMPDTPVVVCPDEITVAASVVDLAPILQKCRHQDHAKRAVEWATRTPKTLRYEPGDPTASFGPVLAIRLTDGSLRPLPAGLQLGACASAVDALATEAAHLDPDSTDRFRVRSEARVAQRLSRMRGTFIAAPIISGAGRIHSIMPVSERHALIIGVASGLLHDDLLRSIEESSDLLQRVQPGATFHAPDGEGIIPGDIELIRLLVVSSPSHMVTRSDPNIVTMTLDDLEWISQTGDADDLFWFCREYVATREATMLLTWETMNAWEWWRGNGKAMHHGGTSPGLIVGAHFTAIEWEKAAEVAPYEEALLTLGLPPLRDWETTHVEDNWLRLVDHRSGVMWSVVREPRLGHV